MIMSNRVRNRPTKFLTRSEPKNARGRSENEKLGSVWSEGFVFVEVRMFCLVSEDRSVKLNGRFKVCQSMKL